MYDAFMKNLILKVCFIILLSGKIFGQTLVIDSILYEGNYKTKNYIIRRELDFKVSDTIPQSHFNDRFKENRSRILNTGLFKEVVINIKSWNTETSHIVINIKVEENWYIYPSPVFEIADRNFNVWWNVYHASLSRVNYGVLFNHTNLTGQNDAFKVGLQFGYNTKFDTKYAWPYWGKNRNWRFTTDVLFSKSHETYFTTSEDKLMFYKSTDAYALQKMRIGTSIENRTSLQMFQSLRIEYVYNRSIPEISIDRNPDYFLNGNTSQKYLSLNYIFTYDDRDLKYYPSNGRWIEMQLVKEGIGKITNGLNTLYLHAQLSQFISWSARHNAGFLINAKASVIRDQIPYFNSNALGYGTENLNGYEYNVIDGMDYLILKFRERYTFLENNFSIRANKKLGIKSIPFKLGISAHTGTAFVNNVYYAQHNDLANRWIYSGGLSLDGLLFNTLLVQLDWSINDRKQSGFYLHFREQF